MTQISPQVSLHGSRLVRFLTRLGIDDTELPDKGFAQRIGQLIDFSQSITLSSLHQKLPTIDFDSRPLPTETIQNEFLRVRQTLVQSITDSFVPGKTRLQYPAINAEPDHTDPAKLTSSNTGQPISYAPYQRFYAAQQREITLKFQYLQSYVRDAVAGLSPRLAQLVKLDIALGDILSVHKRQFLAEIPTLLEQRFTQLRDGQPSQAQLPLQANEIPVITNPYAWLTTFRTEMQGLLLAELEVRSLPVLGLIEAINEEVDQTHD